MNLNDDTTSTHRPDRAELKTRWTRSLLLAALLLLIPLARSAVFANPPLPYGTELARLERGLPAANAFLATHPKERAGLVLALQKYVNGEDNNSGNVKGWLMKTGLSGHDLGLCGITTNLTFAGRGAKKPPSNMVTLTVQRIRPSTFPPFQLRIEAN